MFRAKQPGLRERTPIGELLLEAMNQWVFFLRDGMIVCQRGSQPGVLRLTTKAANRLTNPITHAWCLRRAARFARGPEAMLLSQQTVASVTGPFGWGSGHWRKDYVCVWYCNRPPGVILGAYAIPAELLGIPEQQRALDEAAHIVASAVFNRPAWGADEALTRFLVAQLEADWRHAMDEEIGA